MSLTHGANRLSALLQRSLLGALVVAAALAARPGLADARMLFVDGDELMHVVAVTAPQAPQPAPPVAPAPTPVADPEPAPAAPAPTAAPAQPAPEPARAQPSSRGGSRSPNPDISSPEKFIAVVGEAAQDSQRETKVPASVTIAQAILESSWGQSGLAKKGFNFFGIKAKNGPGPAGVINMQTWEVFGGKNTQILDGFKAYNNIWESIADHGHFLRDNPRYGKAFETPSDPKEFARRIHAAGYATDPGYTTKLVKLMDKYNLYQYDEPSR